MCPGEGLRYNICSLLYYRRASLELKVRAEAGALAWSLDPGTASWSWSLENASCRMERGQAVEVAEILCGPCLLYSMPFVISRASF
jgi:hypothetical protein